MQELTDKVILVAGAATGLGAASAVRLAREGTKAGINAMARHVAPRWGESVSAPTPSHPD